jgi:hypothetical protein
VLIGLMNGIALLYYWTWFVWPFVFVFSLLHAISSLNEPNWSMGSSVTTAVSLMIILAGVIAPSLN